MRTSLLSVVAALALLPVAARAQSVTTFEEDFDRYSVRPFSGVDGWESDCASDKWSTEFGGGVYATSDGSFGVWGSGNPIDDHLVYTGLTFGDTTVLVTVETDDNDAMGVVLRFQDASNFYLGFVTNDGAPNVGTGAPRISSPGAHIYKVEAGIATELAAGPVTYQTGIPQPLQFSAFGTTLELWFDVDGSGTLDPGEDLLSVDDGAFADGEIGFYCYDHGDVDGTTCTFDDLEVNVVDADGDGHPSYSNGGDDCDDHAATTFPGAPELCNGVDDDCDTLVDEGVQSTFYTDADHDGYGDPSLPVLACSTGVGLTADNTDCNDASARTHPHAVEIPSDHLDTDCDGFELCYQDLDGDTWGTTVLVQSVDLLCNNAPGEAIRAYDCAPLDPTIHPLAKEVCDGIDQDCDGLVDEGVSTTYYPDADGDGFGDGSSPIPVCASPDPGWTLDGTDCDDAAATVYPGATEVCDGVDQDCNGIVDDGLTVTVFVDFDGDGFGDPLQPRQVCTGGSGTSPTNDDCDDLDATVYPGAIEITDGIDQDCNGIADDGLDTDGDGLIDGDEVMVYHTDPLDPDTDDDLLSDGAEVWTYHTDPTLADTDGGGVPDGTEVIAGTNPLDPADDSVIDSDGDGIPDTDEPGWGTDPNDADTDDDGLVDGAEVFAHTIPTDADTDDDGLLDGTEVGVAVASPDSLGFSPDADPSTTTDPLRPDTDGDGLLDGDEDADGDGAWVATIGGTGTPGVGESDPNAPDTDHDGLLDGEEVQAGWSPVDTDTDDGGVEDGAEVLAGTDPLDPTDDFPPAGESGETGGTGQTGETGGTGNGASGTTGDTGTAPSTDPDPGTSTDPGTVTDPLGAGRYRGGCGCEQGSAAASTPLWLLLLVGGRVIRRRSPVDRESPTLRSP